MDIMDIASKGLVKITKRYGKKLMKKSALPPLPEAQPLTLSGGQFRAGFAKEEIMPSDADKTYWIAGHGPGHKMEGIISPVYIHAFWLDCGNEDGMLCLSADLIGLTGTEVGIIRKMILSRHELSACRSINISCTHSHSGIDTVGYWGKANKLGIPSDGRDSSYMETVFTRAVEAALKAHRARTPGRLFSGLEPIPGALFTKRRLPEKHEVLSRLRFAPDNGSDEIWVINIGAHPNSLGGSNRMLSGEYPYFMREQIKKETGADVFFGIGAIGAMDAAKEDGKSPLDCIKLQAKRFAGAAEKTQDEKELSPEIRLIRKEFYLPVSNNVLMFLGMRGVMSFTAYPFSESETGAAIKTELTYMDIGGQKIALLPGENFVSTVFGGYTDENTSSTGLGADINPPPLCEIAGDKNLIVFGVTNDMTGYVVPPNDFILNPTQPYLTCAKDRFGEKHYHETNSMGPETQKYIAEAFAEAVKTLSGAK